MIVVTAGFGLDHHRNPVGYSIAAHDLRHDFVRHDHITVRPYPVQRVRYTGPVRCRKYDHHPARSERTENQTQPLQRDERQDRCGKSQPRHSGACGQTDTGRSPQTRSRRQSPHDLVVEDDRTGPDETDTAHHLRRDTARIERHAVMRQNLRKAVLRNDHHERTPQRNEKMGSETRLFLPVLPVQTDYRSE